LLGELENFDGDSAKGRSDSSATMTFKFAKTVAEAAMRNTKKILN
jgi:hypothetical protein